MIAKFVAHAVVWLVVMFCLAKGIEFTDLVGSCVDWQVETGKVAAVGAPRMALSIEYGVAGLIAFLVASSAPGIAAANWLAGKIDLLVAKFKVASQTQTAPSDAAKGRLALTPSEREELRKTLTDLRGWAAKHEQRLRALEKPQSAVPGDIGEQKPETASQSETVEQVKQELSGQIAELKALIVSQSAPKAATRRTRSSTQS